MKLTNGQKEALARKAEMIIMPKRAKKEEELKVHWKPNEEVKEFLKKTKRVSDAVKELKAAVNDAGMSFEYYGLKFVLSDGSQGHFSFESNKDLITEFTDDIKSCQVQKTVNKMYPTYQEIMDELELSGLDKTFDLDSFIKKYENL